MLQKYSEVSGRWCRPILKSDVQTATRFVLLKTGHYNCKGQSCYIEIIQISFLDNAAIGAEVKWGGQQTQRQWYDKHTSIFRCTMKDVIRRGSKVGLMCIIQITAAISTLLCYRPMYLPLHEFLTMSWRVLGFRKEEKASRYRKYLRMYWISRHVRSV